MEVRLEFFSTVGCLLGLDYRSGTGINKDQKEVKFHEIGLGFLFGSLYITWY